MSVSALSSARLSAMTTAGMLGANSAVTPDRLREVHARFVDFNGDTQDGVLVTMDAAAPSVDALCEELFRLRFPLNSMTPVCTFNGSDDASMAANNSSCFNGRKIAQTDLLSIHAYGMAIDFNPAQNPYLLPDEDRPGYIAVYPPEGAPFINRMASRPGMIEPVIPVCAEHGFTVWGGAWQHTPDWHHIQTPRIVAQLCAALWPDAAEALFSLNKRFPARFLCVTEEESQTLLHHAGRDGGSAFIDDCTRLLQAGMPWTVDPEP